MVVEITLLETIATALGIILGTWFLAYAYLRGRYATALGRARALAERIRRPEQTFAGMEDQSAALEELSQFGDTEAAILAARELLGEMDAAVRSAALEVLRRTRALDRWAREVRRGRFKVRIRAIEALGDVGDERAVEELIGALGDDDPDVVRAASQAVLARDPDYASDRLADTLASPDRRLAETAAAVLVSMGPEAVEPLMSQLNSLSVQARRLAVESLGATGDDTVTAALLPLVETDPHADVRVAALESAVRLGGGAVSTALRRATQTDPDWFVRARAYALLAESAAPEAVEFLLEALAAQESHITGGPEDRDDLEVVLEGEARVRSAIISGLRALGVSEEDLLAARRANLPAPDELPRDGDAPEVTDWSTLAAGLRSHDPVERAGAAKELVEAGPQALPHLHHALRDPDPLVRSEAARSIGRIGRIECLQPLSACLQDPDQSVRLAAAAAVRAIVTRDAARADL